MHLKGRFLIGATSKIVPFNYGPPTSHRSLRLIHLLLEKHLFFNYGPPLYHRSLRLIHLFLEVIGNSIFDNLYILH